MNSVLVVLSEDQERQLDALVEDGVGIDRADVMRKALDALIEEEAVNVVLRAEKETPLRGDMRKILLEE